MQIKEEQEARYRADRINALATRIQVTFQKILYEREILLQVAPGFKNVSFLHKGDAMRTEDAIKVKEDTTIALGELIEVSKLQASERAAHESYDVWKQLLDDQAALPMMKQIKKWVDQLDSYEQEMDGLLRCVPSQEDDQSMQQESPTSKSHKP